MQLTLTEKAYSHIREKLSAGQLAPGDRLVTRTLAQEIGVSLGPVREAINRLSSEGLVDHTPGAGASVKLLERQDVEELYVLRDALESCAAGEAALYMTSDHLEELSDILHSMQEICDQLTNVGKTKKVALFHRWLDCEEQFHSVIMRASRNRLLEKVIDDYRAIHQVFTLQRPAPEILTIETAERTCRDRAEIIEALRNRDSVLARQLMSQHIQKGKKTFLNYFKSQPRSSKLIQG